MPYMLDHVYVDSDLPMRIEAGNDTKTVKVSASGKFKIRFPGQLRAAATGHYYVKIFVEDLGPGTETSAPRGRWQTQFKTMPLTVRVLTPDGREFSGTHVTAAHLAAFRDLRGVSQGEWSWEVRGESPQHPAIEGESDVARGQAGIRIGVEETVRSQSAPPLVNAIASAGATQSFKFDLFRVGQFTAAVRSIRVLGLVTLWRGTMRLKDPDGTVVASSDDGKLSYRVTLATLDKSRAADGRVRQWTLEVTPLLPGSGESQVTASVVASTRIRTSTLQERINALLGTQGSRLSIYGENKGGRALARIKILDEVSAETIDMHGLLDKVIKSTEQDPGIDRAHPDIQINVPYNLANRSENYSHGLRLIVNELKVKSISIAAGASQRIQPAIPALKLKVVTEGNIKVRIGGFTLATVAVRDNAIDVEAGIRLDANGAFVSETWIRDSLLDADVHWTAAVAAGIVSFGLLALGAAGVAEYIEHEVNEKIREGFRDVVAGALERMPQIMAMIVGADFTYRSARVDGDDIVFEYTAPLEPDPKPSPIYNGIIGRSVTQLGPDAWQIFPRTLGNTWAADNLAKIDHIVVVMMENRSFDHVLGYRARLPGGEGSNGLTDEVMDLMRANGTYTVRPLNQSELAVKTQIPVGVGHSLSDVTQQLSERVEGPARSINSPKGFVDNFASRAARDDSGSDNVKTHDVLGYYEGSDLPFFKYLAENYAWCERYFCSHAGPTLPNRMLSLTGDVQFDRAGEAIVDNNDGDNFSLSRAMTIYDLFARKGIGWRVYESPPSVTMLRMFARYATDNVDIVPVSRLRQDVAAGNLPPLVIIEPAMHHFPPNDDHPPADMARGQAFLKDVYDTLRSNESLWRKTMLIITYDEHGGLYDHVIPPTADLRARRQVDELTTDVRTTAGGTMDPLRPTSRPPLRTPGGSSATFPAAATEPFISPVCYTPYGVRVPTFVVSPWVPAGKGPDITLDHCSILKTILARFCGTAKPFMSDRVAASQSFNAYLTESAPRMNVGLSPSVPTRPDRLTPVRRPGRAIVTEPVSRKKLREGKVDYHELTGMLARMLGRD